MNQIKSKGADKTKTSTTKENQPYTRTDLVQWNQPQNLPVAKVARMMTVWMGASKLYQKHKKSIKNWTEHLMNCQNNEIGT